ncbi:MAG: S41 family peptidase [Bdellovibrionaceae bacterium]|nr:S41 family peptidase [Pseudobdellovibrionaceae bacterium]
MLYQIKKTAFYSLSLLVLPLLVLSCHSKPRDSSPFQNFSEYTAAISIPTTPDCMNDCVARKKEFRYLAYVGEKIYCYWDEKQSSYNIDFKKKAYEFENRITNEMSETKYFLLLVQWASLFHDGHVNPMLKADLTKFEFDTPTIRFEILSPGTNHESLIVAQVGEEVTQLKVGTVVSKIQGRAWKSYLPEAEKYSMGSTEFLRKRQMANLIFRVLSSQEGSRPVLIEGEYLGKAVQEVIARNLSLYDGALGTDPSVEETGLKLLKTSILENNLGYLRIDGFSGTKMAQLLEQAMMRLQNTDGLLIDVRKNGGGDQSGNMILKYLTDVPLTRYYQRALNSDYLIAVRPEVLIDFDYIGGKFTELSGRMFGPANPSQVYRRPVAVLTSANCFSACDTFVSALKEHKLATVLGENTGGGTGSPVVFELPTSQHKFRYSAYQGFTAVSKTLLEGVGTAPDFFIEPTVQERVEKKDRQLERALEWLSKKASSYASSHSSQNEASSAAPMVLPASLLDAPVSAKTTIPLEIEFDRQIRNASE